MRSLMAVGVLMVVPSVGGPAPGDGAFADLVRQIRSADYRGARADLRRLADAVSGRPDAKRAEYRHYWRGFALWRRALNGFNETPRPGDLADDLKAAIASFEKALAARPDWVEAKVGIVGCAGPLLFLARGDAAQTDALVKRYLPMAREMKEAGATNPRALWQVGQSQLGAPTGADPLKAAATFHRGIEAALVESRTMDPGEPVWIPRWGGAENLMNLAYLYTHSPLKSRDLAQAYAEGALVAAPEWHYVRDILWAEAMALPQPTNGDSDLRRAP